MMYKDSFQPNICPFCFEKYPPGTAYWEKYKGSIEIFHCKCPKCGAPGLHFEKTNS